jgi:lysine-N-methylase
MNMQTRLLILQSFYYEMNELVQKQEENHIPDLIEQYLTQENVLKLEEFEIHAGKTIETIMEIRETAPFNARYEVTFNQMVDGLSTDFNASYGEEFLKNHEYMLENYLANYVFKHLFPFSYGANVYQAFQMLSLHAALLQLHLLGVGSYLREMNEEIAVRVIQSFAKEAEHSSIYLDRLFSHQF